MQKISLKLQQIGSNLKNFRHQRPRSWGFEVSVVDGKRVVRISILWWFALIGFVIGLAGYINFMRVSPEQREIEATIEAVNQLYELPAELPELATVMDTQEVAKRPFFAGAENGDKLLVFKKAQKVILYRPRTNKIINFYNADAKQLVIEDQSAGRSPINP